MDEAEFEIDGCIVSESDPELGGGSRSSNVIPAGLVATVEASAAIAARPALSVPRSGAPFS